MNYKERLLALEKEFATQNSRDAKENIEDLKLTFIFRFHLFEPCQYVSEDEEWLTFLILPPDESLESQIMTLKKDEVISFGILSDNNIDEITNLVKQIEPDSLNQ